MSRLVLLVVGLMLVACQPAKTSTTPRRVVKPKPKPDKLECKDLHKRLGRYCAIVVSRCRLAPNKPKVTMVAIAVLYTADKGKRAANESALFMMQYFGFIPKLTPVGMARAGKIPLYFFIVTGAHEQSSRRLQRLQRRGSPNSPYRPKYENQPIRR